MSFARIEYWRASDLRSLRSLTTCRASRQDRRLTTGYRSRTLPHCELEKDDNPLKMGGLRIAADRFCLRELATSARIPRNRIRGHLIEPARLKPRSYRSPSGVKACAPPKRKAIAD